MEKWLQNEILNIHEQSTSDNAFVFTTCTYNYQIDFKFPKDFNYSARHACHRWMCHAKCKGWKDFTEIDFSCNDLLGYEHKIKI